MNPAGLNVRCARKDLAWTHAAEEDIQGRGAARRLCKGSGFQVCCVRAAPLPTAEVALIFFSAAMLPRRQMKSRIASATNQMSE